MSSEQASGAVEAELSRLAQRIRRWRVEAGLTLQDLAERSGLATSTIQKIETLQMGPSVAVLLKIARGLGRSASDFMSIEAPVSDVVHLTAKQRRVVGSSSRHMAVERISCDLREAELEAWRVTVQPGRGSASGELEFKGEELVLCESGEVLFRVGDVDYRLKKCGRSREGTRRCSPFASGLGALRLLRRAPGHDLLR